MAALCWMAVTLGLFLPAAKLAAVDQNQLEGIVQQVLNMYRPSYKVNNNYRSPMFSVAISIPYNSLSKKYDISKVTQDPGDKVKDTILKCDVYTGTRVVAATVLRWPNVLDQCPNEKVQWRHVLENCPRATTWADVQRQCPDKVRDGTADHAEYRTLEHFTTLTTKVNENDLLLFYVLSSPCDQRCTQESNKWNILEKIKQIQKWNNYAVVFSNVFMPRSGTIIPEENRRGAIERLGQSIGLSNIFRCTEQTGSMQCINCSDGENNVNPYCYSDSTMPKPQRGRGYSPSKSGQRDRDKQNNNINTRMRVSTNFGARTGRGQGGSGRGVGRQQRGGG